MGRYAFTAQVVYTFTQCTEFPEQISVRGHLIEVTNQGQEMGKFIGIYGPGSRIWGTEHFLFSSKDGERQDYSLFCVKTMHTDSRKYLIGKKEVGRK